MDWIVERGVEKIPDGVSFDAPRFVEPVNTCLKGVKQLDPQPGDVVVILGQGPIGLIFTMMVARDRRADRRDRHHAVPPRSWRCRFGADSAFDPRDAAFENAIREMTEGRGADLVIIAASAQGIVEQAVALLAAGARILLFAQTSHQERIEVSGADVCMGERMVCAAPTALRWICRRNPPIWFLAARCRWRS